MADFTKWGDRTSRVVVYKSESQKLHQAFNVKAGEQIYAGNPVCIHTDGTITKFTVANAKNYVGIAITDSINSAYKESRNAGPIEVTVAVVGYAIVNGTSKGALSAGVVEPDGTMDSTKRFSNYQTMGTSGESHFIALNEAAEAGELIQVLCK